MNRTPSVSIPPWVKRVVCWVFSPKGALIILLGVLFVAFVAVMACETTEECIGQLLGLSGKNEILTFLGLSMGGILLALQAVIANIRAKAMENAANAQADVAAAQARAIEEQAKANENTEKGMRQERLKNAIEHLGHEAVSVRLGGAYELFHLAQDIEKLRQTILDILCSHIRGTTSESEYREKHISKPSEEIQSLLTLLFVQEHGVFKGHQINLQESWLNGANLNNARLKGTRFDGAHLQGAKLNSASLQGSFLVDTQLQAATLYGAELQGACLFWAHLQGATLDGAKMQGVTGSPSISSSFKTRMRDRIGRESHFDAVIFEGGFTQEELDSIIEGQPEDVSEELWRKLTRHVGKSRSYILPENSRAITGSYTAEEAEQWIAEYKEAMSEVGDEGNN